MEKRGAFYDQTGALRDMVQNHALQLLCALAMEPPINAHADAIRDEKLKVLRSLKPLDRRDAGPARRARPVRRRHRRRRAGARLPRGAGRRPRTARTETFVALRAEIANWRWAGVPFYIRTGKRLAARDAHIVVNFRAGAARDLQRAAGRGQPAGDQPAAAATGCELHLLAQGQDNRAQTRQTLAPVHLDLDFDKRFGSERVGAYERLLLDVIDGRLNLFVRSDEQEAAWRWVEPIIEHWRSDDARPAALRGRHLGAERVQRHDRARRLLLERGMLAAAPRRRHAGPHQGLACPRWRRPSSAWRGWCSATRAPSPTCR